MLEIYLIRHGRTLFNEKDLVQGSCDSELTQEGVMQAKTVGENMKDIDFTLVFSSPSGRASDTCEYATQNRYPIIYDKRLKEMSFGYLEGEKNAKLREGKPEDFNERCEVGWVAEGGENREMVVRRIDSFFKDLVSNYDNERVLIASHGMWIMFAIQHLLNIDTFCENCSVSKIIYEDGSYKVEYINNTAFRDGGM